MRIGVSGRSEQRIGRAASRIRRSVAYAVAVAGVLAGVEAADAQMVYGSVAGRDSSGIMASGVGVARAAPERAVLYVSFSGAGAEGSDALAVAAEGRDRATEALAALGLDGDAVTLMGVGYGAAMPPGGRPMGPEAMDRRSAQMGLRVVTPVARLDTVLSTLADAGMEAILLVELDPGDEVAARREATRLAVADARAQAEVTAEAAGVRLGPLASMTIMPSYDDLMRPDQMMGFRGPYPGVAQLIPAEVSVRVIIQAVWSFEPGS